MVILSMSILLDCYHYIFSSSWMSHWIYLDSNTMLNRLCWLLDDYNHYLRVMKMMIPSLFMMIQHLYSVVKFSVILIYSLIFCWLVLLLSYDNFWFVFEGLYLIQLFFDYLDWLGWMDGNIIFSYLQLIRRIYR